MFPYAIPFARLRSLLSGLGFQERRADGNYLGFYHDPSGTVFKFRAYGPDDTVSQTDLFGVRFQLDFRGLLSGEAFEASLRKASA